MVTIIRQTWEERYNMYMKCPKEKLAAMLAEADIYLNPDGCQESASDTEGGTVFLGVGYDEHE